MAAAAPAMKDLKAHILEKEMPLIFTDGPKMDLRSLGLFIMTKVIPSLDKNGEYAFTWFFPKNDVAVYTRSEYEQETDNFRRLHKMKKDDGDTTWFFDFKTKAGKKRRCVMKTEIWYIPGKSMAVSPVAMLFGQFFGNGIQNVICRFEDA